MSKRHLGLGKAAKAKKQKVGASDSAAEKAPEASNELTVELGEEIDADDELGQLKGLWNTYKDSDKDNELVINGIIHECDRLLRQVAESNDDKEPLPDYFHSIYAMALAELANFHATDNKQVKEYFDAAIERADLGLSNSDSKSIELLFTKSKILLNRIPLQFVSQLKKESEIDERRPDLGKLLDEALEVYESAEKRADELKKYELFNRDNLDILEALDDLLDIVDNFGKDLMEGEDDDDEKDNDDKESDSEDEDDVVELAESHPLYSIQNTDKYNQWWRDHIEKFLENVDIEIKSKKVADDDYENPLASLRRIICARIGQSYLQEAEIPSGIFTTLAYDPGYEDTEELQGLNRKDSRKIAQDLIQKAIKYLQWAEEKEEPETWVNVAEALISLGNLYDIDSEEQEGAYKKAEEILNKANNITNGKYEDVLENLLQN